MPKKTIYRASPSDPLAQIPIEVEMYEDFNPYKKYNGRLRINNSEDLCEKQEAGRRLHEEIKNRIPYDLKEFIRYFDHVQDESNAYYICWEYVPPSSNVIEEFRVKKQKTPSYWGHSIFKKLENKWTDQKSLPMSDGKTIKFRRYGIEPEESKADKA